MNDIRDIKNILKENTFSIYLVYIYMLLSLINYQTKIDWIEVLLICVVGLLVIVLIEYIGINLLRIQKYKFNYIITFLFLFIFFTEDVKSTVYVFYPTIRLRYIVVLLFSSLLLLIYFFIKNQRSFIKFNFYLNVVFVTFSVLEVVKTLKKEFSSSQKEYGINTITNVKYPNVYILIIDGYANKESLNKYWSFDNSPFINNLIEKGFKYIANSRSNYCYTIRSLSSMLNYDYLTKEEAQNKYRILDKIKYNKCFDLFKKAEYSIYNFSLNNIDECKDYVDTKYSFKENKSLGYQILSKSIFAIFFEEFFFGQKYLNKVDRDKNIIKQLYKTISLKKETKLVLFHNMSLHYPFNSEEGKVYNKQPSDFIAAYNTKEILTFGNKIIDTLWMRDYLVELKNSNNNILKIVDNIQHEDNNAVILLLSDHGFRFMTGVTGAEGKKEAYMNFEAIYLPNRKYENISDNITPINLMRLITNYSLHTNLEKISDKTGL